MKITPQSLTINQLLSSESEQYVVPPYQRRYSWREKQLRELLDDVCLLEGSDTHLMGSIVCLTGHHTAGINKLELVDGQQRLTTLCILLKCIAERLKKAGEINAASDLDRLLQSRALGESPVPKVVLDSLDSADFEGHFQGNPPVEISNPNLQLAFKIFGEWAAAQDLKSLGTFLYHIKNQCLVIRLDVSNARDAFKLFETINNRGLKLSPADIIKNFILGNAALFGPVQLNLARTRWAELVKYLDGISIESFFRHYLCALLKTRVTISFVIPRFKAVFIKQVQEAAALPLTGSYADEQSDLEEQEEESEGEADDESEQGLASDAMLPQMSFAEFLESLVLTSKVYGQLINCQTGVPRIDSRLRNLRMIKATQAYGFLCFLRSRGCPDANFAEVLRHTESLLLRRHICKAKSNESDTLFARLCVVDPKSPLDEVLTAYGKHCPSDERFASDFATFKYTPNLIERARYCLGRIELEKYSSHGEILIGGTDAVHVEHVIPLKIKTKKAKEEFGDWPSYLGTNSESNHAKFVATIGNLTLLSGPLNIGASNNPYERKKDAYRKSAILLTKELPERFSEFRFEEVADRASEFANLALKLWPSP
jgi:hypothetical protein